MQRLTTKIKYHFLKFLSIILNYSLTHDVLILTTYLYFFSLRKSQRFQYFGLSKHRGAQYCAGQAGKFCLCIGNQANKRAEGTMEHAEPRPITEDEFCVLGNLLKIQNC